MINKKKWGGCC